MKPAEWLKTRKHLLDSVKDQVGARLGPPPRSLKTYAKRLDLEFQKPWRPSKLLELQKQAEKADLMFLGDFHAYYQSQRAQLRLLRELDLENTLVFLECFAADDREAIELFWRDAISEAEFLKRTLWDQAWGFPWEHYRDLILHLKKNQVRVRGISSGSFYSDRLIHRDRKMAQIIDEELEREPCDKVIVIVGESHLHPDHLPRAVRLRLKNRFRRQVIVLQDSEELFFKHQKRVKNWESSVLKRKGKWAAEFCWNVSPPWVKWQSYLIHLEQTSDQELEEDEVEADDHVRALAQWICQDLGLAVSFNQLDVYTPATLAGVSSKIPKRLLKEMIASERSFLLDASGKIYLSRMSVNHAASVAGQFIHDRLSQRKAIFYSFPKDLERRLWIETVGFFFSKWMNPSRKAESFESLNIRLRSLKKSGEGRILRSESIMSLVADLYIRGQRVKRGLKVKSFANGRHGVHPLVQLEATRFLGRVFGKALFEAVLARRVSREELAFWLSAPLESKDFAKTFWETIVPRII